MKDEDECKISQKTIKIKISEEIRAKEMRRRGEGEKRRMKCIKNTEYRIRESKNVRYFNQIKSNQIKSTLIRLRTPFSHWFVC